MTYLVCNECNGYYELQEGESPEDFTNKCECGGNLYATNSISNYDKDVNDTDSVNKTPMDRKAYVKKIAFTIFNLIVALGLSYLCLYMFNLTLKLEMTYIILIGIPFIAIMVYVWWNFVRSLYSLIKK
ncbi:MAG: hypothetical protein ACXVHS_05040 [Methanobacterium sp.]